MQLSPSEARLGVAQGASAYVVWGLLPLFLHLLAGVPALEILAHRVVWSLLLLLIVVTVARAWGPIARALSVGRTLALLVASASLIGINWLVYIWAVNNHYTLEASLGYFIIPLVNVALGVTLLGERLRRIQAIAVALAAIGVAGAVAAGGGSIWISLALALTFGTYGLVRKVVAIDALGGLLVETALLAPPSLILLVLRGGGAFGQDGVQDMLLISAGAITATPLLLFAAAARKLRLSTMGLLQFIAPTLQFACATLVFHEPLRPSLLAAFVGIWAGCLLYAADSLRAARLPAPEPAA
ncbi:EamA family transporter RarD [Sphingomonas jatrophae]|uniref:Chloramphenicol-sensitive protein RarD n=1 Tax=Sphingomonas jatrophae TaxID=1166337 RepID=A0A1I6K539_9SPHN|nr:EamA family transporter RarD [Sphingomonas jatrophae]SFR86296.1 chloramphenicol-sensitive protein RarD [Sphingomonas jatrophae]